MLNSYAVATYGHVPPVSPAVIGNYSFGFNISKLRTDFPSATVLDFDVFVDPSQSGTYSVNRGQLLLPCLDRTGIDLSRSGLALPTFLL